ncbi:hypothetical protein PGR6_02900 [Pseudomonas sp. GR 6-02]|nr:hypothetical protein PGR6_02900 [Pseudomonas sp. GR 6-02]
MGVSPGEAAKEEAIGGGLPEGFARCAGGQRQLELRRGQ